MRAWPLVILVLLALGCKKELEWFPQQITKITEGPYTFDVPAGWRDLTECRDPDLSRMARRADDSAHILVREHATNTDSNIALMWTEIVAPITCQQFFAQLARAEGIDAKSFSAKPVGSDELCAFRMKDDELEGAGHVRMHGKAYVTIQCLRPHGGDADLDATCSRFAATLEVP
jgi:hypothetical protein